MDDPSPILEGVKIIGLTSGAVSLTRTLLYWAEFAVPGPRIKPLGFAIQPGRPSSLFRKFGDR